MLETIKVSRLFHVGFWFFFLIIGIRTICSDAVICGDREIDGDRGSSNKCQMLDRVIIDKLDQYN